LALLRRAVVVFLRAGLAARLVVFLRAGLAARLVVLDAVFDALDTRLFLDALFLDAAEVWDVRVARFFFGADPGLDVATLVRLARLLVEGVLAVLAVLALDARFLA
jgi:hypothetical protein